MRYLSDDAINQLVADQFADEIREEAEALQAAARTLGFSLEIRRIADAFSIVTVQPIRELAVH